MKTGMIDIASGWLILGLGWWGVRYYRSVMDVLGAIFLIAFVSGFFYLFGWSFRNDD